MDPIGNAFVVLATMVRVLELLVPETFISLPLTLPVDDGGMFETLVLSTFISMPMMLKVDNGGMLAMVDDYSMAAKGGCCDMLDEELIR